MLYWAKENRSTPMLRIAVCDDSPFFLELIEKRIRVYFAESGITSGFRTDTFSSGRVFAQALKRGVRYDIVFLDWLMPDLDGERTGRLLRFFDENCILIIITAYPEYALRAFPLTTFRYILKDRLDKELAPALEAANKRLADPLQSVTVRAEGNAVIRIRLVDLFAVEYQTRRVLFYTRDGVIRSVQRVRLQDFETTLRKAGFVMPFKGILVNGKEIREKRARYLVMSDHRIFPVSRHYQKEIQNTISNLPGGK